MKKMLSLISALGVLLTALPFAAYAEETYDPTVECPVCFKADGNIAKFIEEYQVEDGITQDYFKEFWEGLVNNPDNVYYYENYHAGNMDYAGLFYDENGEYRDALFLYNRAGHDVVLKIRGHLSIFYLECDQISEEEFNALSYKEKFEKGIEIYNETGTFPFLVRQSEGGTPLIYDDETLLGDVNADNTLDVADCTYITQYLASPDSFPLTDAQKEAADVTGSGDGVTAEDALAIQKYLVGTIDTLG